MKDTTPTKVELQQQRDEARQAHESSEATLHMTVARLGGLVEGAPTHRINFLQRIDELREIERGAEAAAADRERFRQVSEQVCRELKGQSEAVARLRAVASEQAEDETLWFIPETQAITEAHLQAALRRLHRAIEGEAWPEDLQEAPSAADRLAQAVTLIQYGADQFAKARAYFQEAEHALQQSASAARPWFYTSERPVPKGDRAEVVARADVPGGGKVFVGNLRESGLFMIAKEAHLTLDVIYAWRPIAEPPPLPESEAPR